MTQRRGLAAQGGQLWPALGILTVLTYNTWLLWRPLNGQTGILDGYLSELSAIDQPNSLVFRAGDLITALLVIAIGVRGLAAHDQAASRWRAVMFVGLLIFGAATLCDAFLPMDCSPALDPSCRDREKSGDLSTVHYAHTVSSVTAQTGIITSMIAAVIVLVRAPGAPLGRRRAVLGLASLQALVLIVMMIMLLLDLPKIGYAHAALVLIASLWFAMIGFWLIKDSPQSLVESR